MRNLRFEEAKITCSSHIISRTFMSELEKVCLTVKLMLPQWFSPRAVCPFGDIGQCL